MRKFYLKKFGRNLGVKLSVFSFEIQDFLLIVQQKISLVNLIDRGYTIVILNLIRNGTFAFLQFVILYFVQGAYIRCL